MVARVKVDHSTFSNYDSHDSGRTKFMKKKKNSESKIDNRNPETSKTIIKECLVKCQNMDVCAVYLFH